MLLFANLETNQVQLITSLKVNSLKNAPTHPVTGRQPGNEVEPGKNTCCSANISFSLSGERLHSSKHQKMSLTNQHKDKYPLELKLSYIHIHSIN